MNKHTVRAADATPSPIPSPESTLRLRLMERIRTSLAHESQFQTVRREGGDWQHAQTGVRRKALATTLVVTSELIELAPGATLPQLGGVSLQEVVLMAGELSLGGAALEVGDAVCAPQDAAHLLSAGAAGAQIYLRSSTPTESTPRPTTTSSAPRGGLSSPAEPDLLKRHDRMQRLSPLSDDAAWQDFCPGVRIRELWDGGVHRSVLVRMAAGARVNAHKHGLEEECLMLAGEAFIGDTLLRSGEYQLAPQGSRHGAIQTDVGALFFVHGSLDPVAYA